MTSGSGAGGHLLASFPVDVRNGGGIGITKQGLATRIALDLRQTQRLTTIPAGGLVPVQDPLTGLIGALPVTALPTAQTGDGTQTNAKLASMPARTFKANLLNSTAPPQDVNFTQVLEALGITSGGSVATTAANVSVTPPASQGYTNVQGAITSIESRITSIGSSTSPARTIKGNAGSTSAATTDLPIATMADAANGNTDTIMTATTTKKAIDAQLPVTEYIAVPPVWATYNFVKDNFNVNMGGYPKTCRAGGNQIGTTEAIAGLIDVPASADNNNAAHGSGIAGYCRTKNTKQGAVAIYGFAFGAANNTSAWGGNTCVTNAGDAVNEGPGYNKDGKGSTNINLWGWEFDFEVVKTPSGSAVGGNMTGLDLVGNSTTQPLGSVVAFRLQPHGIYASPPVPWKEGYRTEAGAVLVAASIGQLNATGQSQSSTLEFRSRKGSFEEIKSSFYLDPFGALTHKPAPGGAFVAADSNGTTRLFAGDSGVTVLNSNFGVGVTTAAYPLQVRRDSASYQVAEISNLNSGAGALLQFVNAATPAGMEIGAHPSQEGFLFRVKGNPRLTIDGFGHTTPALDAQQNLGNPSFRWGTLYASTGTIQTSDGTAKVKPDGSRFVDDAGTLALASGEIPVAVLDAWDRVTPVMFRFADAVAAKGAAARTHFGYIAQDVVAQFEAAGLDAFAYGLVGYDPVIEDIEETREIVERRPVMVEEAFEIVETFVNADGFAATRTVPGTRLVQATKRYPVLGSDGRQATEAKRVARIDADGTPIFEMTNGRQRPVYDDVQAPLWHDEPVFENVTVEMTTIVKRDTGRVRLNLRYDQCAVLEGACQRRRAKA